MRVRPKPVARSEVKDKARARTGYKFNSRPALILLVDILKLKPKVRDPNTELSRRKEEGPAILGPYNVP
jgi:hypothetical protein